jgi:hypothetical protein
LPGEQNENGNGMSNGATPRDHRTIVVLAEGVAELKAEVAHLKEDTRVIRQTHHEVNNRLQELIAAERLNATNVGKLTEAQTVTNVQISQLAVGQERLSDTVQSLLLAKSGLEGAWKATLRIGALTALALGAGAWVIANLQVHFR